MIFICTPYSHKDKAVVAERYDKVCSYIAKLLVNQEIAFSPIVYGHPIVESKLIPGTWDFWNKFCVEFLRRSTVVHVLMQAGWEESKGVQAEIELAKSLYIPIVYIKFEDI